MTENIINTSACKSCNRLTSGRITYGKGYGGMSEMRVLYLGVLMLKLIYQLADGPTKKIDQ